MRRGLGGRLRRDEGGYAESMTDAAPEHRDHDQPDDERAARDRPAEQDRSGAQGRRDDPLRGSLTGGIWAGLVVTGLVLVLLVVFIVQNTQSVEVSFLAWTGRPPLAAALLVAAAAGILITALTGTLRIWQLRRRVKKADRQR